MAEIEKTIHYEKKQVLEFFESFGIKAELVECGSKEIGKAKEFLRKGMHWLDALHAAIAISAKCDFIASFNVSDFKIIEGLIPARMPLELIN